jgi:phage terminase large subunit
VEVLKKKPYVYGSHFAPHDIDSHSFSSGLSAKEVGADLGIRFTVLPTLKVSLEDGIEAVRGLFPRLWFDEERCKPLIRCLENYRKEFDQRLEVYKDRPRHDKFSHGADAVRYMAIGVKLYVDNSSSLINDEQADKWFKQNNPRFD